MYKECCLRFIKLKQQRDGRQKPKWWSDELSKLVRKKRRLFIQNKITKWQDLNILNKYRQVSKLVTISVRESVTEFEKNLVARVKESPKLFFNYVNKRFASKESISALKDKNGRLVTEKSFICNELNDFFYSVFDKETSFEEAQKFKFKFAKRADQNQSFTLKEVVTNKDKLCFIKDKLHSSCIRAPVLINFPHLCLRGALQTGKP